MSNIKTAKRGELIYKEGEKISSLFLIQSGSVHLCLVRNRKNIELMTTGAGQVLGSNSLAGQATHDHSCVANSETKYMEIPIELARAQVESAPQFVKILIKSINERTRLAITELKSLKIERDPSPLPDDQIAKAFAAIFHSVNHKGEKDAKDKTKVSIDWILLKQYAQRVFGESPRRLEQTANLLAKLGFAKFELGKSPDNPDGPDEISNILFTDLAAIEGFFEFYQYYYFKGGRTEILKVDESMFNLLSQFIKIGETLEKDRLQLVSIEFPKAIELIKTDSGINLNNGHFANLESKGVFAKRNAKSDGTITLQWEQREFIQVIKNWKILKEIDRWNEKGFVDMHEEEKTKKKVVAGGTGCPQCGCEVAPQAKFCQECGAKVVMEKAG